MYENMCYSGCSLNANRLYAYKTICQTILPFFTSKFLATKLNYINNALSKVVFNNTIISESCYNSFHYRKLILTLIPSLLVPTYF